MENISGSFPYVNHNPEFRWKPYFSAVMCVSHGHEELIHPLSSDSEIK